MASGDKGAGTDAAAATAAAAAALNWMPDLLDNGVLVTIGEEDKLVCTVDVLLLAAVFDSEILCTCVAAAANV